MLPLPAARTSFPVESFHHQISERDGSEQIGDGHCQQSVMLFESGNSCKFDVPSAS